MKRSPVKNRELDPIVERMCAQLDAMQIKLEQTEIKIKEHLREMREIRGEHVCRLTPTTCPPMRASGFTD